MLGKLIKYEMKDQWRFYRAIYIGIGILALFSMSMNLLFAHYPGNMVVLIMHPVSQITLYASFLALMVGMMIYIVLRFRKNLLKDEGYLMHTLPVTAASLVESKLICNLFWAIANGLVLFLAQTLSMRSISWLTTFFQENFIADFGTKLSLQLAIGFGCYLLLAFMSGVSAFYACMSFGYRSSGNKDVMSVVAYIAIYAINQVLSFVVLSVVFLLNFGSLDALVQSNTTPVKTLTQIFVIVGIMVLILQVIYTTLTVKNLQNHLNLE